MRSLAPSWSARRVQVTAGSAKIGVRRRTRAPPEGDEMSDHAPPGAPATGTTPAPTSSGGATVRAVVIAASIGAAVIHFAYAPAHFEEKTLYGWFFLVLAWVQIGSAFALARWRSARWPWVATAAVNAAVIAIWLVSRTAGLPGS